MSKKDILYLMNLINDVVGLEILKKALEKTEKRIKQNALRIANKRKQNKMYARSQKEIQAYNNAQKNKELKNKGGR